MKNEKKKAETDVKMNILWKVSQVHGKLVTKEVALLCITSDNEWHTM